MPLYKYCGRYRSGSLRSGYSQSDFRGWRKFFWFGPTFTAPNMDFARAMAKSWESRNGIDLFSVYFPHGRARKPSYSLEPYEHGKNAEPRNPGHYNAEEKAERKLKEKPVVTSVNPKQVNGDKKPNLMYIPLVAQIEEWKALKDGAIKYDPDNWLDNPIEMQTYIDAMRRHLELFSNGEDRTRDTDVHNLGAIRACAAIILDAAAAGTIVDNRRKRPYACDYIHEQGERYVAELRELYKDKGKEKISPNVVHSMDAAHINKHLKEEQTTTGLTLAESLRGVSFLEGMKGRAPTLFQHYTSGHIVPGYIVDGHHETWRVWYANKWFTITAQRSWKEVKP